ncbi:sugar phosphate isomerase/epimerase [Aliifodinibius sp. S!AR15-10]|uniref:sugar phosphate isomerase/epimerase family protein n=1 Tax=Aliifodinibius sp. S!AR15-10 TaxID=2950437 RepID=UPI002859094C|nr:sugar phosphate isomerase/epimerase family protein [Aliifodinibius sp. S!AR15-10]MDR8393966.1 sugar phosphate isomerase/epimerase [Aliifodinibius sp. S!AR15-10]
MKSLAAAAGFSTGLSPLAENFSPPKSKINKSAESIKVAVFSKHLEWLDYKPMAETAAELGFDGVDLTVRPGGHVLPENVTRDLPKAVQAVRNAGLEVLMISTAIGGVDQQHTEPILKTASDLGITNYRTDWYEYDDGISFEQNLEQFKERLSSLADLNEQLGIQGDYQNHSGSGFGASILDLWMVLEEIGSDWLGAQYDIRHATVEGAESWPVGFKAIYPHIGTLDIKDFHWTKQDGSWQVQNVPLGEGQVDFDRYFELLKKYGVTAPMSVHYEYPLGGANHGDSTLTIPEEEVLKALKRDLETLRGWLSEHGLG